MKEEDVLYLILCTYLLRHVLNTFVEMKPCLYVNNPYYYKCTYPLNRFHLPFLLNSLDHMVYINVTHLSNDMR